MGDLKSPARKGLRVRIPLRAPSSIFRKPLDILPLLPPAPRMTVKKASGGASNTNPTDTARYALPLVLRGYLHFIYALARLPPDGGLCFKLNPGRSPEHQTKERQQQQDNEAFHAANSFTLSGVCAVPAQGVNRVTDTCVQRAGWDDNKDIQRMFLPFYRRA